jgi:anti-sigma-K factor RskA
MTCDEVRDLLPAYALGLLEGDEREAVEAHLRAGREHDDELVELRATSFALEMLDEEAAYSAGLQQRIKGIATTAGSGERGTPSLTLPPGGEGTEHILPITGEGLGGVGRRARPRWWLPAAAVLALLVMFGAGWAAHATFETSEPTATQYSYALQGAAGQFVSFMAAEESDHVSVTMAGLPRLTDGQLYRLWAIRDGEWVRIGQCNTDQQGGWDGDFAFSLQGGDQLAVTVEAPSADPQQHGTPILSSQS